MRNKSSKHESYWDMTHISINTQATFHNIGCLITKTVEDGSSKGYLCRAICGHMQKGSNVPSTILYVLQCLPPQADM